MNKWINIGRDYLSRLNFLSFLVLLAALHFPLPIIRVCWAVWCFSWLAELRFLHRENFRPDKAAVYLSAGVAVWLVWNIISVFWAADTHTAWNYVGRYCSLLPIPLIGLFGVNQYYDWKLCVKVLLISALISVGVYLFTYFWFINRHFLYDKHVELQTVDWWHVDDLLLNIKHRMHYTNLLCMLFPCLVLFRRQIGNLFALIAGLVLLVAVILTGSRVALISLSLIAVITLTWFLLRYRARWIQITGVCIAALLLFGAVGSVLFFHPRNEGMDEPRLAIWQTALEQPADYLTHGLGAGNATNYLVSKYEARGLEEPALYHYSPHNQFLGVCMDLGLPAALLFVLFWMGIPLFFHGITRYWSVCVCAVCACAMMTDMLLSGLEGLVFVVVMTIFAYLSNNPRNSGCGLPDNSCINGSN